MKQIRKHWKKIFFIIIVFAAVCLGTGYSYLELNPLKDLKVNMLSLATSNENGETVVVDESGKRIFKTDNRGKVQFIQYGKKDQEQHFYEARALSIDSKGNYYVLDIQRRESGRWVERERILKYDANGKYVKTVLEYHYDEDEMVLKNRINRIDLAKDTLYYYVFTKQGFQLCTENGVEKEYFYKDAEVMLVDFSYDEKSGESAVITKKGEILKTTPDMKFKTIIPINTEQKERDCVPWHGEYDQDGNYFYIDIGKRAVYKVTPNGVSSQFLVNNILTEKELTKIETIKKASTYYVLSTTGDFITINSSLDQIVRVRNGVIQIETQYSFNGKLKFQLFLIQISAIFLVFLFFYGTFWFLQYLKKNSNMKLRIVTGCIVGAMGLTVIFTMLMMKNWTTQMTEEVTKRAASTGQTVVDMIEGNTLGRIQSVNHYMNQDYQEIRSTIRSVFAKDESYVKDLYCVLYRIPNGIMTATYSIEDYSGAVYPYADSEMTEQMIQTIQNKKQFLSVSTTSEGIFLFTMTPIYDSDGNGVGLFEVGTNMYEFRMNNYKMIFEIILNSFVIAIMVILIIFELLVYGEGKKKYNQQSEIKKSQKQIPVIITRIFIFVMCFATSMTRGFLPIFVMKQSKVEDFFGFSYEILLSFILSAEVLFNAIFAFAGDKILRRIGRRKTALLGSFLFVLGMGFRAIFPTILFLIIGNSIMGAGAGILVLIIQIMLAEAKGAEKDEGFAGFTAGSLSGVNCGVVFGAFLINWMNYQAIFCVVTLVSLYLVWYVVHFIYDKETKKELNDVEEKAKQPNLNLIRFLISPRILLYYIGIVIPMVAAGYFLSYLFPILATSYKISETNIGYACLINGLCIICFGNIFIHYLNKRIKIYQSIVLSVMFYAGAFLFYAVYPNILTLLLTLVLLGLADGFGMPIQGSYYTNLCEVEQYGYDRSMSIYSLFENLSQVAGSFLFSVILIGGVTKGLLIGGIFLIGAAGIFALGNRILSKRP